MGGRRAADRVEHGFQQGHGHQSVRSAPAQEQHGICVGLDQQQRAHLRLWGRQAHGQGRSGYPDRNYRGKRG